MGRVVVLGSLNVDLVAAVERHPGPGETILADGPLAAVRRRQGRQPGRRGRRRGRRRAPWSARSGTTTAAGPTVERLRSRGVDVSAVRTVGAAPTGQAWITVDDEGENAIVVIPGANAEVAADRRRAARPRRRATSCCSSSRCRVRTVAAAARAAHGRGARVVVNAAPYAALPHDVAALADPLVVNEHEALQLGGQRCRAHLAAGDLRRRGVQLGRRAVRRHTRWTAADVVDTTGAGDAFCGALAAALAQGADRPAAVAAARRRARSGAAPGAQPDPEL